MITEASPLNSAEIQELRQRALDAWMEQVPKDTPEGWSKSPVDPVAMLQVFSTLHLKPGFALRAYQYRQSNNGNGVVWAMPENLPFPEPNKCPPGEPPRPSGTLDDVMESIEGDGSPLSYLHASLLARELAEFGAFWHGVYWGAFQILDADPWTNNESAERSSPREGPTGRLEDWKWIESKPNEWQPTIVVQGDEVEVKFYTFCGLGSQKITHHVDRYIRGKYSFTTKEQTIAEGPRGYVW
jgi:hypothetical protein